MTTATIHDYDGLIAALRARIDEIGVSYDDLETLCGFTRGHLSKILGPVRVKNIGLQTLLILIGGLALRFRLEPDLEAAQAMAHRWERRDELRRRLGIRKRFSPEVRAKIMSEIGRMGGAVPKRFRMTDKQRSRIAKRNIRKRWEKRRNGSPPSVKSQYLGMP